MSGGWDSPGAPICPGYKRPAHATAYVYANDYCSPCRDHRSSDAERAELGKAAGWDDDQRREATGS